MSQLFIIQIINKITKICTKSQNFVQISRISALFRNNFIYLDCLTSHNIIYALKHLKRNSIVMYKHGKEKDC
jgi:hypothetical protein